MSNSNGHSHNHGILPLHHHVCVMEGSNPAVSLAGSRYDALAEESERNIKEIQRLKAILAANNISWNPKPRKFISQHNRGLRSRTSLQSTTPENSLLPSLPTEILVRILTYSLTNGNPIIDPFYKLRRDTISRAERSNRERINIHFLATCKAFHIEGARLLFANNTFVFTQLAALENFSRFSKELRSSVQHVTLRVVGRYYDDVARKVDFSGMDEYHPEVPKLMLPVLARPVGMNPGKGIQSYCWEQVADFLKALVLPHSRNSKDRPKLFPCLVSMRLDLVNFSEHLPYGMSVIGHLIRYHLGHIVDELIISGAPMSDIYSSPSLEEDLLSNLVRDEGLVGSGPPIFVSTGSSLKPLFRLGLLLQLVRRDSVSSKNTASKLAHVEGGTPPASIYPPGTTVWKWTAPSLSSSGKKWIEFERRSGLPADDIDFEDFYPDGFDDIPAAAMSG